MTPERYQRVRELFHAVCELPASERGKRLRLECAGDESLMADVEDLLAQDSNDGDFLGDDRVGFGRRLLDDDHADEHDVRIETLPESIGPYKIVRKLGQGGMGVVYEATQSHPSRRVALKVLRPGFASKEILRRFRHEIEIQGRLQHPGIGHVYDAGMADTPSGRQPYFAMQLVVGEAITTYSMERQLDVPARLQLVADVCDAVQHAHESGIIHRDLKPGNIIVEASGRPIVLDFGVARATDADIHVTTVQTAVGQLIGTIPYMSPEQIGGDSAAIDARSDVYSLGVVLYEMLAGQLPYDLTGCSIPQAAQTIQESSARRLSSIDQRFRGEIETIVGKALRKEKEHRYQTAGELAADIRRYLANEPVVARPAGTLYQLHQFARRNKALVGGVIATFVALVMGIVGASRYAFSEARQRSLADSAMTEAERLAYRVSVSAAADALQAPNALAARRMLNDAPERFRNWEWDYLSSQTDTSIITLCGTEQVAQQIEFTPDGAELISRHIGTTTRWNCKDGERIQSYAGSPEIVSELSNDLAQISSLAAPSSVVIHDRRTGDEFTLTGTGDDAAIVAIDSQNWRTATVSKTGTLRVWNTRSGAILATRDLGEPALAIAWSPTRDELAVYRNQSLWVLDGTTLETVMEQPSPDAMRRRLRAVWRKDGDAIFARVGIQVGRFDTAFFHVIHGDSRFEALGGHFRPIRSMAYFPANDRLITTSTDGEVLVRSALKPSEFRRYSTRLGAAYDAALSPDGRILAIANASGAVETIDVETGESMATLLGPTTELRCVAFSPDGGMIAAGALDGTIRLWPRAAIESPDILKGHASYIYPVAFSADGRRLASASWDKTIRIWDTTSGACLHVLEGMAKPYRGLAFTRDGSHVMAHGVMTARGRVLIVHDLTNRLEYIADVTDGDFRNRPAFDESGKRVWVPGAPGPTIRFWHFLKDEWAIEPIAELRDVASPLISADKSRVLLISGNDATLNVVDVASGEVRHRLCSDTLWANWSPDGRRVVVVRSSARTPMQGKAIEVWDAGAGVRVGTLEAHIGDVFDAAYSRDGSRILTAGRDARIRVWDAETLEHLVALRGHHDYVWSLAVSPDGRTIASGSGDSTVRLWRAPSVGEISE